MIIEDSIQIYTSPAEIYEFFVHMDQNYLNWHPDHKRFAWKSAQTLKLGTQFYFEEKIAGKLLKKSVVVTRLTKDTHIEFAPTFWLMRFFLPSMIFKWSADSSGSIFIAQIHLRMGPLAQKLHAKEITAIKAHMREEGENLKYILENPKKTIPTNAVAS